jgi:hypothetical protein
MVEKKKKAKLNTAAPVKRSTRTVKKTANKKIVSTAKKTVAGKAVSSPRKPVSKKAGTKKPAAISRKTAEKQIPSQEKKREETSILMEAAMSLEAGAKSVSKYASVVAKDVAERTSKVAEEVIKKTRKGISEVYDISSKAVEDAQHTALDYIDRYKNSVDMKIESTNRQRLTTKLGNLVFLKYLEKDMTPEKIFEEKKILDLIAEIKTIENKIVQLGKKLEKNK